MFSLGAVVSLQSVQRTEITILNLCVYFLRAHIKFAFDFSFQRIRERERETYICDLRLHVVIFTTIYYNFYDMREREGGRQMRERDRERERKRLA